MKYLIVHLVLVLVSCSEVQHKAYTKDISVMAFQSLLATQNDLQILDVRTPDEWAEGIVQGAVQINWYEDSFNAKVEVLDKNKPVVVYCKAGGRSKQAMYRLAQLGFKKVYNLEGGYDAYWSK